MEGENSYRAHRYSQRKISGQVRYSFPSSYGNARSFNYLFISKRNACASETMNNLNRCPGCFRAQNKMGSGRTKKVILALNLYDYHFHLLIVQSKMSLGWIKRVILTLSLSV